MAGIEACDERNGQSVGDDGVVSSDRSTDQPPQTTPQLELHENGSCPETAGCGDQVGLSGGGSGGGGGIASTQQQMDRPADGRGDSHHASNQDGDNEVSSTASSSSGGEIHSNNQQVGGGTTIQPGKLSEDHSPNKGSELNFLPFGSRCQDAQVKRLDWFLDLRVFETFVGTNHT